MNMLEQAVKYIMLGFLYKFVLAQIFGSMLLPSLKAQALAQGGIFNLPTLGVMYVFGFENLVSHQNHNQTHKDKVTEPERQAHMPTIPKFFQVS